MLKPSISKQYRSRGSTKWASKIGCAQLAAKIDEKGLPLQKRLQGHLSFNFGSLFFY